MSYFGGLPLSCRRQIPDRVALPVFTAFYLLTGVLGIKLGLAAVVVSSVCGLGAVGGRMLCHWWRRKVVAAPAQEPRQLPAPGTTPRRVANLSTGLGAYRLEIATGPGRGVRWYLLWTSALVCLVVVTLVAVTTASTPSLLALFGVGILYYGLRQAVVRRHSRGWIWLFDEGLVHWGDRRERPLICRWSDMTVTREEPPNDYPYDPEYVITRVDGTHRLVDPNRIRRRDYLTLTGLIERAVVASESEPEAITEPGTPESPPGQPA